MKQFRPFIQQISGTFGTRSTTRDENHLAISRPERDVFHSQNRSLKQTPKRPAQPTCPQVVVPPLALASRVYIPLLHPQAYCSRFPLCIFSLIWDNAPSINEDTGHVATWWTIEHRRMTTSGRVAKSNPSYTYKAAVNIPTRRSKQIRVVEKREFAKAIWRVHLDSLACQVINPPGSTLRGTLA